MRISIKNTSLLDRQAIESFISAVPPEWIRSINVIMIDSSSGDQIVMSYYRKKKILGIHIPNTYGGTPTSALEEVAITMQAIAEHGVIPNKLSVLRYKKYKGNWEKLKESYS